MQTLIKHKCAVHVVIQFFHQLSQILGGLISASASARCTLSFNFAIWNLGSGIWDLGRSLDRLGIPRVPRRVSDLAEKHFENLH